MMNHPMPYLLIAFIGIVFVFYLMVADRRRMRMQRLMVKKLHASPMFAVMKPYIMQAQRYSVESLTIDKTGFTFRYLFPFGYETRFLLSDYGYPNLTAEKQEALLLLLEEFVPKLTAHSNYSFRSIREKLLDGHVEYQYKYIIRIDYKTMLARAPYYDGSLQSQMW